MSQEEFVRPYTELELNEKFEQSGFPEIARQYCIEYFNEVFSDRVKEYQTEIFKSPNLTVEELQEALDCESTTLRENTWERVVENRDYVNIYVEQREAGHGHEWAKIYSYLCIENVHHPEYPNLFVSLIDTYSELREQLGDRNHTSDPDTIVSQLEETLSGRELLIAIKNILGVDDKIMVAYLSYNICEGYHDELDKRETQKEWYKKAESFKKCYAKLSQQNFSIECPVQCAIDFFESDCSAAYIEAIRHHCSRADAKAFAEAVANHLDGTLDPLESIWDSFTEDWQQEFLSKIAPRSLEDFEPIEMPHQRKLSRKRQFERDMLQIMFPNDDVDSEDFEDGLDMEDAFKD